MPRAVQRAVFSALLLLGGACVDFGDGPRDSGMTPGEDAAGQDDAGDPPDVSTSDVSGVCTEGAVDPIAARFIIHVSNFMVDPTPLTVAPGDIVAWSNDDSRRHRFLSGEPENPIPPEEGGFDTTQLQPGASYGHRFCTARTVTYYCSSHPGTMRGFSLVVE